MVDFYIALILLCLFLLIYSFAIIIKMIIEMENFKKKYNKAQKDLKDTSKSINKAKSELANRSKRKRKKYGTRY